MYHIRSLAAIRKRLPRELARRRSTSLLISREFLKTRCTLCILVVPWELALFSKLGGRVNTRL